MIVHPHSQSPQGETEHDTGSDELKDVDGVDAGKRGLRMTMVSENRPTIRGKAMSLHVGRRFGMFSRSRASLVDHRGSDKPTPYTIVELA
jgi:hypothetical protein